MVVCMYVYIHIFDFNPPPGQYFGQKHAFFCTGLFLFMDNCVTHPYVWHDSFACVMNHSYVWHDQFNTRGRYVIFPHDSFIRAMTCPYVWRDVTRLYTWHNSCIRVAWLIRTREKTHLFVWHDLFICVSWLTEHWYGQSETWMNRGARRNDSCHIWMSHATHRNASCHIYDTGVVDHRHYDSLICVTWIIHMCDMTHLVNLSNRGCVM